MSTYPPEFCTDMYQGPTMTGRAEMIDGGTIGTVSFPSYYGGTSIHPWYFPTREAYQRCLDDDRKMTEEHQAKIRQREQERYERYLATRTRWQAFRDGMRMQRRLFRNILYAFAIAVFGAGVVGGLVVIAIILGQFFAAVLEGNWIAIMVVVIALAVVALIVAVHIDDGKDY